MKKFIAIHHTAVKNADTPQLWAVNRYHKGKWNMKSRLGWYVGYNYFIDTDGTVTQTRAWSEEQIAQVGNNCDAPERCTTISICLADNYNESHWVRTEQNDALLKLIKEIKVHYPDLEVVGHRDLQKNRTCPGKHITQEHFDMWNNADKNDSVDQEKEEQIKELQSLFDKLLKLLQMLRNATR